MPTDTAPPRVTAEARTVLEACPHGHSVGAGTRVPDGDFEGGRACA